MQGNVLALFEGLSPDEARQFRDRLLMAAWRIRNEIRPIEGKTRGGERIDDEGASDVRMHRSGRALERRVPNGVGTRLKVGTDELEVTHC